MGEQNLNYEQFFGNPNIFWKTGTEIEMIYFFPKLQTISKLSKQFLNLQKFSLNRDFFKTMNIFKIWWTNFKFVNIF